ncbi:MAG: hypothetical protein HFJ09_02750 [Lachnospiraceae bacterium]|nr:hypothetical protein [Lachnospiraceae bacterium]
MKKRLVLVLSAILCAVCLCSGLTYKQNVCYAAEEAKITGTVTNQDEVIETLDNWYYLWNEIDFELQRVQYALNGSLSEELEQQYKEWDALKKEAGEAGQITEYILSEDKNGNINASAVGKYENGSLKFTLLLDKDLNMLSDIAVQEYEAPTEKASFAKAGTNTVMSISIVFVVLIFIAFVIYLLKFIPRLFGLDKKDEPKEEVAAPVVEIPVEEDVTDDTELVAVITAAIMASMGDEAPADGLVVSSIKRRTGSKWKTR